MTTQDNWTTALKQARSKGARVRQNVQSCCRGCVSPEQIQHTEDGAYAFTFGGQGMAYTWKDDTLVYRASINARRRRVEKVEKVYFNHGFGGGQVIADAFRDAGFEVEWDGNDMNCVAVLVP